MAVIKNFTVQILVDGKPRREYDDNLEREPDIGATADSPRVTKYIEAIPGAQFSVEIKPKELVELKSTEALLYEVYLDGKCIEDRVLGEEDYEYANQTQVIEGQTIGDCTSVRKFEFVKVKTRQCY
jgi:hypothetical protein